MVTKLGGCRARRREVAMTTAITLYLLLLCVLMAVALGVGTAIHRGLIRWF